MLLHPETVAGQFIEPDRKVLIGNLGIMSHQKLSKAGAEAQKDLFVRRLNGILPCRKTVQITFKGRMLIIIHQRRFHLQAPIFLDFLRHPAFNQAFDKAPFRVEAQIARIRTRLIIH